MSLKRRSRYGRGQYLTDIRAGIDNGFRPFGDDRFTKPEEVPTLPITGTCCCQSSGGILMLKFEIN